MSMKRTVHIRLNLRLVQCGIASVDLACLMFIPPNVINPSIMNEFLLLLLLKPDFQTLVLGIGSEFMSSTFFLPKIQ